MELTETEQAMLDGAEGPGVRQAMEIVVALGAIYGAQQLVPVGSAQISGVSYRNLGPAGLDFLRAWADTGARVRVPTTLNPAGMDLQQWRELGFSETFAHQQQAVVDAYERLGVRATCTCTPYLIGVRPAPGEHVAWAESSAVSFANSVLGARTNREGGPSALAAAITGRTAAYGLHVDAQRRAGLRVQVRCPLVDAADFGALGYLVGRAAGMRVPYFEGLALDEDRAQREEKLKALGAAMAASGAVALYHVDGVTPEAGRDGIVQPEAETLLIDDLSPGYAALDGSDRPIDLVWLGCPHSSLAEIERVAGLLRGRKVRAALWLTTARQTREEAQRVGLLAQIEASGGRIVADTCIVVAPMRELNFRTLATASGKGACYVPAHAGLAVRYGTVAQCIEAAVSGEWG